MWLTGPSSSCAVPCYSEGELRGGVWSAWGCTAGGGGPGTVSPLVSALLRRPLSVCQDELGGDRTAGTAPWGGEGPVGLAGAGDSGKSLKQTPDCIGSRKQAGREAGWQLGARPGSLAARAATGQRLAGPCGLAQPGLLHSTPPSSMPVMSLPLPPVPHPQPPAPAAPATAAVPLRAPCHSRRQQQRWVCGEVSHVYLCTPEGGREERGRETLSLRDRNDILTWKLPEKKRHKLCGHGWGQAPP